MSQTAVLRIGPLPSFEQGGDKNISNDRPLLRRRRLWRWCSSEVHAWRLPRTFIGLEVGVITREAAHASHNIVGKQRNIRVVILNRLVVAATFYRNAVLGSRELILEAHEIFVGFQLRI